MKFLTQINVAIPLLICIAMIVNAWAALIWSTRRKERMERIKELMDNPAHAPVVREITEMKNSLGKLMMAFRLGVIACLAQIMWLIVFIAEPFPLQRIEVLLCALTVSSLTGGIAIAAQGWAPYKNNRRLIRRLLALEREIIHDRIV